MLVPAPALLSIDLLTPDLGERFSDDARVDVCGSACSKRHNHMNGSVWPMTCPRRAN